MLRAGAGKESLVGVMLCADGFRHRVTMSCAGTGVKRLVKLGHTLVQSCLMLVRERRAVFCHGNVGYGKDGFRLRRLRKGFGNDLPSNGRVMIRLEEVRSHLVE
jgi:hypothetical protein